MNSYKKSFGTALFFSCVLLFYFWCNIGTLSVESLVQQTLPVKNKICHTNLLDNRTLFINEDKGLKMIYYVTPTYPRPEQVPELTRLAQTLMHVPRLHWIVADDTTDCSDTIFDILRRSRLPYTHLSSPKPHVDYKAGHVPRGVANRRASLTWIHDHVKEGVLYFGDDDNTVDLRLFDEIRATKKVSMFPVGLIGQFGVSSPIVKDGKVVGFFDSWPGSRTFPVDMAGFAINIKHLTKTAKMPYIAGHEEDKFLVSLGLKINDIEPLAKNCTEILVWHTQTVKYKKPTVKINIESLSTSSEYPSMYDLLKEVKRLGMVETDPNHGAKPFVTKNHMTYDRLTGLH